MKIYLNKIGASIFLAQGIYFLYRFAIIFPQLLSTFDYSFLEIYLIYISAIILFIVAAIGFFRNKNWAIICGWIAVLLPQILRFYAPAVKFPLNGNNIILLINVAILIYISTQWRKSQKNA